MLPPDSVSAPAPNLCAAYAARYIRTSTPAPPKPLSYPNSSVIPRREVLGANELHPSLAPLSCCSPREKRHRMKASNRKLVVFNAGWTFGAMLTAVDPNRSRKERIRLCTSPTMHSVSVLQRCWDFAPPHP